MAGSLVKKDVRYVIARTQMFHCAPIIHCVTRFQVAIIHNSFCHKTLNLPKISSGAFPVFMTKHGSIAYWGIGQWPSFLGAFLLAILRSANDKCHSKLISCRD